MENVKLVRTRVKELDEILGIPFKVLDDGFIRVIDYMGTDESIVQAARVSYGKGTKKSNDDNSLIKYLMRHMHTTPFEMCEIKLHIRVPMDCWRQWIRHRTANVNEYSTRYSVAIDSMYMTDKKEWRMQSKSNKQGSAEFIDEKRGSILSEKEESINNQIREIYMDRLSLGVAREQARKVLPLSTYTEAYWKIDLHNLFHFLALRMDSNAQYEIRSYANIIGNEIVSRWCPLSWKAFNEYKLNSIILSEVEVSVLNYLISNNWVAAKDYLLERNLLIIENGKVIHTRELIEMESKFLKLGFKADWVS